MSGRSAGVVQGADGAVLVRNEMRDGEGMLAVGCYHGAGNSQFVFAVRFTPAAAIELHERIGNLIALMDAPATEHKP